MLKTVFWAVYGVLVFISAIIVAAYLAFRLLVKPPEQVQTPVSPSQSTGQTAETPPASSEQPGDISQTEPPAEPERVLTRRDGVYTFLLTATDEEGVRTDTMMVLTYDIPNQKVGVVSVPRDTLTRRSSDKNPKLVYGPGSAKQRREDISAMLGIPIDYYVKVNIKAFVAVVDYLGGVDFYVPCDMDYDDPAQNLAIHYTEGKQHLDGQAVMEVARFRKNNDGTGYSDVGRTQTQQKLLVALAKKVLNWNSLTKINGFVKIFDQYVSTDLELDDMLYFASQAIYVDTSTGVETATLAGRGDAKYRGYTYCYELDRKQAVDTVNRLLNPYNEEMTLEDMDILKASGYMT